MTHPFFLPAISFFIMIGVYIILSGSQKRSFFRQRLKFSRKGRKGGGASGYIKEKSTSFILRFIKKFKKKNKGTVTDFRTRFERCGWDPYSAVLLVPIYKGFSVLLFLGLFFILNTFSGDFASLEPLIKYAIFGLMFFIGYRSFDYLTDFKIAQRRNIIVSDFPMAIDLLVVCVRGGLPFGQALDRIAQEVIHTNPELARELAITSAELGILPERKVAYENLARRVDSDLVKTLTTSLIQSEEQGVAIGKTLMFLSQESSKQKLMMIERQAAKLPAKLTVPVVLLSLPAILIIILGPTIAAIMDSDLFSGGGG